MGLLNRLFGKKIPDPDPESVDPWPPEVVRAVELQREYWIRNDEELADLEARDLEQLSWSETLRLHHLICLHRRASSLADPRQGLPSEFGQGPSDAKQKCADTVRHLASPESPYRPRPAVIWQYRSEETDRTREPDMEGELINASYTHLGCLEILRVDSENQPAEIDFVSFDELASVAFAPPSLIRGAQLVYEDGGSEIVPVPMLYGITWTIGKDFERDGRSTRFVAHLDSEDPNLLGVSGMGIGQQDFSVSSEEGQTLFGIASVAQISFGLDVDDPRFDERARARGLDPGDVRSQIG